MTPPSSAPLLRCDDLVVGYGSPLLPAVSLAITPGSFWAVLGRNGSGKTTWFRTMLGLLPAVDGTVQRADDVRPAYVAQRRAFDDLYPITAAQVVALGLQRGWGFLRPTGFFRAGVRTPNGPVREAMQATACLELARHTFRSLSEGQKQRVLLARMVASGAQVAFLDEPTAAMDAVAEGETMALLDSLRTTYGLAVVVVSHHLAVALKRADHVLFLDRDCQLALAGTPEQVLEHPTVVAHYGDLLHRHDHE